MASQHQSRSSASGLFFKQLGALMWKNLLVRKVHFISTFFELFAPLLLILAFAAIYSGNITPNKSDNDNNSTGKEPKMLGPIEYENPKTKVNWDPNIDFKPQSSFIKKFMILFSPNNSITNELMLQFENKSKIQLNGYDTEEMMSNALADAIENSTSYFLFDTAIGVHFENVDDETMLKNGQFHYRIRFPGDRMVMAYTLDKFPFKFDQRPTPPNPMHIEMYQNFFRLQSYINREYIRMMCHDSSTHCTELDSLLNNTKPININRMPYPKYRKPSDFPFSLLDLVAAALTLSYVLVCPLIVKRITDEKSTKAKELLRLIGMSDFVFYFAHFLSYFILILIHIVLITIIVFGFSNPLFQLSSPILFAFGLLIWSIQLILFSMTITTVFNRPVLATIVTVILWIILSSVIFQTLVPSINTNLNVSKTNIQRLFSCLTPSGTMIWFISIVGAWDTNSGGLGFNNINSISTTYLDFTVLNVWLMAIASCPIYIFLIWYLDNVWPFQHGVPKKPWFLFTTDYWSKKANTDDNSYSNQTDFDHQQNPSVFEAEPNDLYSSIQIKNVGKVFNSITTGRKVAVNNLSLNIFQNQITVLLGHNGAGKTTTMNMITGMYGSTSGTIFVNGYNVVTQTKQARRSIGLCPQENIIFNELTVAQHLRLFAKLKDHPNQSIESEVDNVLCLLKLSDKKNVYATSLSGGMKRKLALAIALIGDTETLILDEPTSGMDPDARRVIWDLLLSIRRKRTVLLTTHYMEEADVLGDRIAIMNDGRLCCSGAPFFLKNAFGTGYRLRIAKKPEFDSQKFIKVIKRHIPGTTLNSEIETEVIFTLDDGHSHSIVQNGNGQETKPNVVSLLTILPELFDDIEKNKIEYGIESCGLSYATLEDVFLTVGSDSNLNQTPENEMNNHELDERVLLTDSGKLNNGFNKWLNQFWGLLLKRFHFARRYWLMILFQIVVPGLIILFAMIIQNSLAIITSMTTASVTMNVRDIYGSQTETFCYGSKPLTEEYKHVNTEEYSAIVRSINSIQNNDTVNNWILNRTEGHLDEYIQKWLYGFGDRSESFENWVNWEQFHSLPLSINVLFESIVRMIVPKSIQDDVAIIVESSPLLKAKERNSLNILNIFIPWVVTCLVFLPIAFPFLAASYILYPIKENASKAKLIQLMTGLSPFTFWLANFVFDLINHLLAVIIIFLIIFLFDTKHIFNGNGSNDSAIVLFILLFAFGVSTIPLAYFLSYPFKKPSSGFVFLIILFLIVGFIGNIIFSSLDVGMNNLGVPLTEIRNFWYPFLLFILRFIPIFSMLFGYQKVQKLSAFTKMCKAVPLDQTCRTLNANSTNFLRGCCPDICGEMCYATANPFAMNVYGSGIEVIYMLITGLVSFLLIALYETFKQEIHKYLSIENLFRKNDVANGYSPRLQLQSDDSDVERERIRIENEIKHGTLSDLLTIDRLTKRYDRLVAVDQMSVGIHYNECFGLLGVNGAGKTTTFSMLTGDQLPTSGEAFIQRGQYSLVHHLQQFQQKIGYCPQFDALLDKITGEETLYLFGRLRGIPSTNLERDVRNLIKMVGLESHATKRTDTYSGGNKRKLSIAIALIGNPALLFLDEPSAGVDPAARRKIWQTLGYLKRNFNCSIVLTSHSMEECEALCSRIGIMVNGRFRCLGSTQQLRTKYGQGYSVTISLKPIHEIDQRYTQMIQEEVVRFLPSAVLKDYHQSLMHYHVTDPNERWSNIFRKMSELNQRFDFQNYFVSDTTLEQIFIMFARHQAVVAPQSK